MVDLNARDSDSGDCELAGEEEPLSDTTVEGDELSEYSSVENIDGD